MIQKANLYLGLVILLVGISSTSLFAVEPQCSNKGKLIWSEEFNTSILDTSVWLFETGAGGWENNELQNYTNGENML